MAYRATLKDVAAAAGVSVTTVSLVLNNRPARVSEEKRKAIADAAKKLNYVPNQSARSLVTKQSQLVALIVPDIENLFFAALAKCVEDECAAQGYSLVLNNRPARVSEEKRKAIADAAKKLNYVPNQSARSLVTKQSQLVALIVPDIENLFFAALAKCVEDECAAQGYSLIVANSDDSRAAEHELLQRLPARGVDGVMLIPARESCVGSAVEQLCEDVAIVSCPVVLIDRLTQCGWCDAVGFDNYLGGRLAAQYLLEGGHTRIGIVTGDIAESSAAERRRGFVDAIEQSGKHFDSSLCVEGDYRFDSGYRAANQIIDGGATAVFCCNDVMALGFRQRMAERGLHVTEDMQVIGYDNILKRFGLGWRMTTVEQSVTDLAAACWGMLRKRIDVAVRAKSGTESGDARPWLSDPQVEVLTPKLVQAACA